MTKKALLILADGFEEIEASAPIDILRRAGVEVTVAGLDKVEITGAHSIKIKTDILLNEAGEDFDAVVLPGGLPGADNLAASELVNNLIKNFNSQGKIVAAICASPSYVLQGTGILKGKSATCYPGAEGKFSDDVNFKEDLVVVDGNIITSRGPATAMLFGYTITEALVGKEKREELENGMLYKLITS